MAKVLLWHPGAAMSVSDVATGLAFGLRALGVEVVQYHTGGRLDHARAWMTAALERARDLDPATPDFTDADVIYRANDQIVNMALRHQPDWVLRVSGLHLHPDLLLLLRRARIKVGLLLTESPYDLEDERMLAALAEFAWTNERRSVARLRDVQPDVAYLPHAWTPGVHDVVLPDATVRAHDVVFVGTAFQERLDLLAAIDWTGIDLGLYGAFDLLPAESPLRAHVVTDGVIPNTLAAQLYRNAKIGLNLYRTSRGFGPYAPRIGRDEAESLNPRAYELAACGAFQIADARAEGRAIFGASVPTFTTPETCGRLIRAWLPRDAERRRLAAQSQRAVASHTWVTRVAQMIQDLSAYEQREERRRRPAVREQMIGT